MTKIRLNDFILFSTAWELAWQDIAKEEGWLENEDIYPWDFTERDIEPLGIEKDGETEQILGIMVFADGTIEFREKTSQEALNWTDYSVEVNTEVLRRIKNN